MKLHKVKTLNLNSLYGEHVIDFEKDLDQASLFLILGQTGAGKSTILDAICLGLFGVTPRLTRATGRPETDARHVMSYGTGRCRAEVHFSLKNADGERHHYRAVWECRRAYEKASGTLQDPIRSLYTYDEEGEEKLIVSDNRLKYFEPHFEEILEGMSVEDFQRSILLAQGEFAAFLKADEEVKASILEKLTSTDEYKLIGQRASAKRRDVERDLKDLLAKLDGLQILDEEDERELREHLADLEGALELARADLETTEACIKWLERLSEIEEESKQIAQAIKEREKAQKDRQEDLARLELDRACRPAEPTLEKLDEVREQVKSLQESHGKLEEDAKSAREANEKAAKTLGERQEALVKAREALEKARPDLESARNIVQRQESASKELARVKTRAEENTEALEALAASEKEQQEALAAAASAEESARAAIEDVDGASLLDGELRLEVLAAKVTHYADVRARVERARSKCQEAKESASSARAKLEVVDKQLEEARERVAPQRDALAAAKAMLDEMLEGTASSARRREVLEHKLDDARESLMTLDEALRLHEQLCEKRLEQANNKRTLSSQERDIKARQKSLEVLEKQIGEQRENLEGISIGLRSVEDKLVLSDHRKNLDEHEACPLCGSEDHPLIAEQSLDEVEAQLESDREKLVGRKEALTKQVTETNDEIREAELDLAALESAKANTEARRTGLRKELDKLLERYNGARHRIGFVAIEIFPGSSEEQSKLRDGLVVQRADLKREQDDARSALVKLDELVESFEGAREALRLASENHQKIEVEQGQLSSKLELLEASLHESRGHLAEVEEQRDSARDELASRFSRAKISLGEDPDNPDFKGALERARALRGRYEQAMEKLDQARKEKERLENERARSMERLEAARSEQARIDKELASRKEAVEALEKEREGLLDGRAPEDVQKELEEAISSAEKQQVEAREAASESKSRLERLQGSLQEKTKQLEEQKSALEELEQNLADLEKELGKKEAALRESLLSKEDRKKLEDEFATFEQEIADAKREQERLAAQMESHGEQRPEDERLDEFTPKKWEKEHARVRKEVDELLSERGGLKQQVEAQEKAKKRSEHMREELDALQSEYRVWETIHRLIGTKDGEGFKQFAQSLNLQELVDRANMRLDRLAPRYSLAVAVGDQGEPKLDFAVIDHHQADAHRPLTTLSGGETFLVSLALALGLSDFRRVEMPVETLLLDEGFGTLDQETLDVAMATLRQLQQESVQQIGIISHVESLKERVDTRIVVEKLGNGRSTLFVESANGRHGLAVL